MMDPIHEYEAPPSDDEEEEEYDFYEHVNVHLMQY